jgi:predicted AlkP superfamily pyrophosphatase or phosphodiesterase
VLTGLHPGHHGILHNAWFDRATGKQVITNSPATWHEASSWLFPGVETIHDAVHRTWPGACTASINEPTDAGADFSTFDFVRRGISLERPPAPDDLPNADQRFVRPVKEYRWSSRVDHTTVQQFLGVWSGEYLGGDWPRPKFTWCNFSLTDAAFHEGGPHSDIARASIRDTDARLGQILSGVEQAAAWDRTAFFLVADHGMEETKPGVTGDWGDALRDAGIAHRDEAFGFIYLL